MAFESRTESQNDLQKSESFVDTVTHQPVDAATDPTQSVRSNPENEATIDFLSPAATPRRTFAHTAPTTITKATDYQLIEKIGEGGMGVVYEGWQNSMDRLVALKLGKRKKRKSSSDRTSALDDSPKTPKSLRSGSFLAEAILTGHLEHPNIIPIYDLGIDDEDQIFYAMKRVKGKAWRDVLAYNSIDENLDILLDVADAVAFAHSRRIVHQDIKPNNVLLGEFGEVLLTDWGLAFALPEDASFADPKSVPGGGTPAYMAPEMASGRRHRIGRASDIYLLGAVLFEIITGHPPHQADNAVECIRCAAENKIVSAKSSDGLHTIALRAMAFEPNERYSSVQEFQKAIREHRSHAESHRLCDRAAQLLLDAKSNWNYESFGLAITTYQEALKIWTGNEVALGELLDARVAYAECAYRKGDLDLAESLLLSAGAEDSAIGTKVRELKKQRQASDAEQVQLRAAADKWMSAFLASPDCVLITRLGDGTILEANDVFLRTMACSRAEVVGKSASQLNNWVDLSDRELFVRQLQQRGECSHLRTRFRTFEGEILPMELSGRILKVDDETAVISHARDLTERNRVESELDQSRAHASLLEAAFDAVPTPLLVFGTDMQLLFLNDGARAALGFDRGTSQPLEQLVDRTSGTDLEHWRAAFDLAATGTPQVVRCGLARTGQNGEECVEFRLSAIPSQASPRLLCSMTRLDPS